MDKAKYSKYCLVPQCESSSIKTPGKIFISLPVGSSKNQKKRRMLWLRAMRRNTDDISENTRGFVCEDHFNFEEDMENYLKYKVLIQTENKLLNLEEAF
ncbi:hypothetical protein NQ317_016844 [Molorchus minor]|uniref:THAP-type domain-containing protein n=1 Tax=Molorchus minor TaxID=1323400 RepID=A0ABQ9JL72_9CUCU|nr:hypothetical protein NQ317_016844 [Molorchus minor]